ncbi:ErfK/YbiS/YcfS/YnhG family protein [Hoeflea sp. BAL378]|uniref:L,D-transpeptidase n=1 Tax=Hoeflea sp. BAL378 TaxID=1547437 RepID=UPI000512D8F1|nr:L,D-transpeptidase [Hoeflea sp. BAL378]KGF69717.1 ErfK/YbiS/YcfS/YnhG family protein [Hoeflea sp. BAL378]
MLPHAARAAALRVFIDLSTQEMQVRLDGRTLETWPVSTGRPGYGTPKGDFPVIRLAAKWYSRKYDNAPMPYSVFFRGGYAIHGTTEISKLGRPASHGCVRLHPDNARILFNLVRQHGAANTRISIHP